MKQRRKSIREKENRVSQIKLFETQYRSGSSDELIFLPFWSAILDPPAPTSTVGKWRLWFRQEDDKTREGKKQNWSERDPRELKPNSGRTNSNNC